MAEGEVLEALLNCFTAGFLVWDCYVVYITAINNRKFASIRTFQKETETTKHIKSGRTWID